MFKKLLFLILVFVVGGAGGALLPGLVVRWWPDAPFLFRDRTVIVNKTEEVLLREEEALEKARRKVLPAVVTVQTAKGGVVQPAGSGLVVGSDGLVLTRREVVSAGSASLFAEWEGNSIPAEIVRMSDADGLALLRIKLTNLPVVSFAESPASLLGHTVFLMGVKRQGTSTLPFINAGVIKSVDGKLIETSIEEKFELATGTPLVTLDGNIVGINSVNSSGYVFAISSDTIKEFLR